MIAPPPEKKAGTATRILDVAQRIVQMRGFNAFSYADVADVMNVTKASLHYHFPSKAILGEALIRRYLVDFKTALLAVERASGSAAVRLHGYAAILYVGGRLHHTA
ncbi:MAG: TetR/AcrR family transcriptional regulator [Alphaproteobacteria bacterium]|nr:TetR/AcrR family transcriptional regulator [Alphaproteobacteria bacterium]